MEVFRLPKIKSLEELRKLREEAIKSMKVRESTSTKITVGMGTCGIAAGAREVMHTILDELEKRKIDANVITVGCIGLCAEEPLVTIERGGQPGITYGKINVEKVPKLIEEHLIKGNIIDKWVISRG